MDKAAQPPQSLPLRLIASELEKLLAEAASSSSGEKPRSNATDKAHSGLTER